MAPPSGFNPCSSFACSTPIARFSVPTYVVRKPESSASRSESQVITGMPTSFARTSARAIALAFDGDTARPSTRRVIRSSTTWIWSASVCSLGPM